MKSHILVGRCMLFNFLFQMFIVNDGGKGESLFSHFDISGCTYEPVGTM